MGVLYKLGLLERRIKDKYHSISSPARNGSFPRAPTPSIVKTINRDKHQSLVFIPFRNSLLGLVFLLVPNSEYRMKLQVARQCSQARGQNIVVSCFYFDYAARREQSAINMLGSLLKQMISGIERIPREISRVSSS